MQKVSGLTKYFGIPSLATLGIGGGLLAYSANASNKYENFIEETYKTVPMVKQLDATENTVANLGNANRALTYYMISPQTITYIYNSDGTFIPIITPQADHYPSTNESVNQLQSARNNIEQKDFSNKPEIQSMVVPLKKVQGELEKAEKSKPESYYILYRDKISGIKAHAEEHVTKLREEIPGDILQVRDSLRSKQKTSNAAGLLLSILGGICSSSYGAIKLFSRKLGLS